MVIFRFSCFVSDENLLLLVLAMPLRVVGSWLETVID